jgi:hypothetical protein
LFHAALRLFDIALVFVRLLSASFFEDSGEKLVVGLCSFL